MDIRRWFTSPKASTTSGSSQTQKNTTNSNEPSPPTKKNPKSSKKRRIIESDSDEEPIPKTIVKDLPTNKKSPKKVTALEKISIQKAITEKGKEVSIADFFGSAPVNRIQKKELPQTKKIKEASIHEDDDFQATLAQLDSEKVPKGKKLNGHKNPAVESEASDSKKGDQRTSDSEFKSSKKKDKESSNSETKKEKSSSGKRKSKHDSSFKMEMTPNTDKPVTKIIIKEEKPMPKKPRGNAGDYASYLHREGPKALGSKEIPTGEDNCLAGLSFVITGVLESMERDEAKSLVEKYGGKVMTTLSKNTKYIVIGRDAGASKLDKAEKFGTKQLDEDGLLDLVRTMPGQSGGKSKPPKKDSKSKTPPSLKGQTPPSSLNSKNDDLDFEDDFEMDFDESVLVDTELAASEVKQERVEVTEKKSESPVEKKPVVTVTPVASKPVVTVTPVASKPVVSSEPIITAKLDDKTDVLKSFMWVDKYKPTSLKQVIGQQGDKSNAKKLLHWLLNWNKSRRLNKKPIPGRFNAADDGSAYKAALLSGPPGVGKTTTAILVCKETAYDYFELNASDTRSKKNLQQAVSQLLGNQTLADCFKDNAGKVSNNHVIVMDEVDGMAGNEDRGGMMELISFIKASKVPIICICNDRNHTKIRSLSNYCFDLRFQKPRVEQIKAAMMSIAFKEKVQVSQDVLQDVIIASNQDIRQVLHNISMWSARSKNLSSEQTKSDIGRGVKHIKMGPFDVLRDVFAIGNNPSATLMDKSDLFFHDYAIAPLFVQENYVHVVPKEAQGNKIKHLTLLSEAADSICIGDTIDRQIRNQMSWGLLPTQAIFASVIPGELLKGHLRQMISFPAWLGKNSNRNHMDRVLQELHVHMRMRVTGNKTDVALDYLPLLKRALTKPLIHKENDGIPEVLKIMEEYYLLREDFDSIIDLSLWPDQKDPRTQILTKVKSAFTRAYNKESGKNPYTVTNVKKKKASAKDTSEELPDEETVESEEEEDDSIEKDAMIKVKKPTAKKGVAEASEPSTSSKGKKKNPTKNKRSK